jgi:two-component system response regulator MprA
MRILLIEDNRRLNDSLRRTLEEDGYAVDSAYDGLDGEEMALTSPYDVILLDVMLPGKDGITVCRDLRNQHMRSPILMLTARDALSDRVTGLDSGADDYLVKPFAPAELVARLHALLRRPSVVLQDEPLVFADLCLNPSTREIRRNQRAFELTAKEFDLLHYFLRHPRQVLRREQILQEVWGYELGDDNVLEVYVGYLRRKLEAGGEPRLIQTVRAVGYVLREE